MVRRVLIYTERATEARFLQEAWRALHPGDEVQVVMNFRNGAAMLDVPKLDGPLLAPRIEPMRLRLERGGEEPGSFQRQAERADLFFVGLVHALTGPRNFMHYCALHGVDPARLGARWFEFPGKSLRVLAAGFEAAMCLDEGDFQKNRARSEANMYCSWLHALNAWPVLAQIFAQEGARPECSALSKYQLQLLLHLAKTDLPPLSINGIVKLMLRGRSAPQGVQQRFGSMLSCVDIFQGLVAAGLMQRLGINSAGNVTFVVSPLGMRVAARVHPALHEPELQEKIGRWGENWTAGRPAMEEGFRLGYAKQIAFMGGS